MRAIQVAGGADDEEDQCERLTNVVKSWKADPGDYSTWIETARMNQSNYK